MMFLLTLWARIQHLVPEHAGRDSRERAGFDGSAGQAGHGLFTRASTVKTVELLKDYIRNEQQRHDVFVKDGSPDPDRAKAWLDENLALLSRMAGPGDSTIHNHQGPSQDSFAGAGF